MGKSYRVRILFPSLCLALIAVLAAALGEVLARQLHLSKTWASYIDRRAIMRAFDDIDRVGFTRVPNASFVAARDIVFHINDLGFRDANRSPGSAKTRVSFLGDSVTEGFGVEIGDRFSELVGEKLNSHDGDFESMNFGVSANATVDQLEILKDHVLQFSPRIVVLQVCKNDFERNGRLHSTKTGDRDTALPSVAEDVEPEQAWWIRRYLQSNSAFYLFLAERYNYIKLSWNIPSEILPTGETVSAEEWRITFDYLREMDTICREHDARLMVTYIPLEVEVLIKEKRLGTTISQGVEEFCVRNDILHVNTIDELRSHDSKHELYLDDCHLSILGHELVAQRLHGRVASYFGVAQ